MVGRWFVGLFFEGEVRLRVEYLNLKDGVYLEIQIPLRSPTFRRL